MMGCHRSSTNLYTRALSLLIYSCLSLLGGCSNKLAGMPDNELQDKSYACKQATEQSPGFAISCDNYQRECERRREAGRFLC